MTAVKPVNTVIMNCVYKLDYTDRQMDNYFQEVGHPNKLCKLALNLWAQAIFLHQPSEQLGTNTKVQQPHPVQTTLYNGFDETSVRRTKSIEQGYNPEGHS